ncbi:hypothetical protein N7510_007971 [Penicillium lagena]|uniref:uncharacterized protein n=1 Tax=Penicillium lagena TaxID=94218 RepID=UPI002540713E|nr:uncharacterized protein N7510_007971 [Penicillium lagena]KAJ5611252.1 hypothetical protein N7510_007971 [Penicillium lagena]
MSLTRGHSCVLCQQRKVRCDQQKPCSNCVRAQVECKIVPLQPARRRKKKLHERELIERLKKCEALLAQHGVDFDSVEDNREDTVDIDIDQEQLKTSPEASTRAAERNSKSEDTRRSYRTTYDLLQNSSDEEIDPPSIHHAFDKMFTDTGSFPFGVGGSQRSITHLHPSAVQIFQLWQIYITNVNSLLKINHVPTLQKQVIGAIADISKASRPLEALMFSIYLISSKSMTDEETQATFGAAKHTLLAQYGEATQQALVNASFMKSNDLMVLQAYFLYLHSSGRDIDPRSLFCLIGIAVRIATRLGIHRDGAQFGVSPFETELRRRLWWQIAALDKRIAEITGSGVTALFSCGTDCRLPLNVNDSDLHPHAKDPPRAVLGPTEMIVCLTRIEMLLAAEPTSIRPNTTAIRNPQRHSSAAPSPNTSVREATRPTSNDLDSYSSYIESVYLKNCDPNVPTHLLALMLTRSNLCKLRVLEFMCRGAPAASLDKRERDALFVTAIEMLEWDDVIYTTESLKGFLWYTQIQGPLPGYIFLISELRQRTTGELCERAWKVICDNHDHRGFFRNLGNPVHNAFGHALLRAWDAHEEAELQLGRNIETPPLVIVVRQRSANQKASQKASHRAENDSCRSGPTDVANYGTASGFGGPDRPGESSEAIASENTMLPALDRTTEIYNAAFADYEQTNWTQLMQSGVLSGFYGGPDSYFSQGGGY